MRMDRNGGVETKERKYKVVKGCRRKGCDRRDDENTGKRKREVDVEQTSKATQQATSPPNQPPPTSQAVVPYMVSLSEPQDSCTLGTSSTSIGIQGSEVESEQQRM
ncbi:hypothetical protein Pcinc_038436 [Petrolisthes cinctipes]|uniref:Uncharacterized protein n=1 Tax=Petrolisthes cinctipes TaxID=88211 RepID=A0AAE1BTN1_PETCI|nr:hypothetical protein Pcinc_038436 [Petrolisthes cinctipes]